MDFIGSLPDSPILAEGFGLDDPMSPGIPLYTATSDIFLPEWVVQLDVPSNIFLVKILNSCIPWSKIN